MIDHSSIAVSIFLAGVERVLPDRLICNSMSVRNDVLYINDLSFNLLSFKNIYVVGAGKASALMGAEVERILGDRITAGHIAVKYGHGRDMKKIKVTEAGHPVPDENGYQATQDVLEICRKAGIHDLVICLLSGGGSALLPDSPEGVSNASMMKLNDELVKSGAAIDEINTVRKHLSDVKGGRLAQAVFPATLISLILSDVIGDPPDVIASGPTVADTTTYTDARSILEKYIVSSHVPPEITSWITKGCHGLFPETPKPGNKAFEKTYNILIGTNRIALQAAAEKAKELGFESHILTDRLEGDVLAAADYIVGQALEFKSKKNNGKAICLLIGGEPTVRVTGNGSGGRNQHLALLCAVMLRGVSGITILAAGTDGSDGPTPNAGAVVDGETYMKAIRNGNNPEDFLKEFNTCRFFSIEGGAIVTGPTMTNVMDIIAVLIW
jgi:glycerate 2-kinase